MFCNLNPWMHSNLTTIAHTRSLGTSKNKIESPKFTDAINIHINYIPL